MLALINVPCQSSLSNDIENDFCHPSSFLSCKYVQNGRWRTQKSVRKYQNALVHHPWVGGWETVDEGIFFFFT